MFRPPRRSLRFVVVWLLVLVVSSGLSVALLNAREKTPKFCVIAIAEHGGIHKPFVDRATIWLDQLAAENNYDKSPRANVHVLTSVDEKTYIPNTDIKMWDHPIVWTNEHKKARNMYTISIRRMAGLLYSSRKVMRGSTRVARCAGT
jgi:hypothetical protein